MNIEEEKATEFRSKINPFLMRLHGQHRSEAYYKIIVDDLKQTFNLNIFEAAHSYGCSGPLEFFKKLGYELDDGGHFVITEKGLQMNQACQNIVDLIKKTKPKRRPNGNAGGVTIPRGRGDGSFDAQSHFNGGNAYGFASNSCDAFRSSMLNAKQLLDRKQRGESSNNTNSPFGRSEPFGSYSRQPRQNDYSAGFPQYNSTNTTSTAPMSRSSFMRPSNAFASYSKVETARDRCANKALESLSSEVDPWDTSENMTKENISSQVTDLPSQHDSQQDENGDPSKLQKEKELVNKVLIELADREKLENAKDQNVEEPYDTRFGTDGLRSRREKNRQNKFYVTIRRPNVAAADTAMIPENKDIDLVEPKEQMEPLSANQGQIVGEPKPKDQVESVNINQNEIVNHLVEPERQLETSNANHIAVVDNSMASNQSPVVVPPFDADIDSVFYEDEGIPSTPPLMPDVADYARRYKQQSSFELPPFHTEDHMVAKFESYLDRNSTVIDQSPKIHFEGYSNTYLYLCKLPNSHKYGRAKILKICGEYAYAFFVDYLTGAIVLLDDCREHPNEEQTLFIPSYFQAIKS
uniref:Uncharacterized protein n=1 Tax=Panagrolaimus sp. JU765 TaxID=591449 RepID=A0AC34R4I2_9BILA